MRLTLIFGFLGSGKTTLVRRILEKRSNSESTAVIVNEFGDVGIDGDILEGNNIDMVQLNSGCLCCTLKGSLISAIEELHARSGIERIIIEASGVSEPSDLLDSLWDPKYGAKIDIDLGPVVAVVDTPKFTKISEMLGDFYTEQVVHADVVLLNKIDNAASSELNAVYQNIASRNPNASLIFTEQCGVDLDLILDGKSSQTANHNHHHNDHQHGHEHGHLQFDSLVLSCESDIARESIEMFFQDLDPKIFRAKGFLIIDGEQRLVQFATGQLDIHPANASHHGQMVFIGQGLDRQELQVKFDSAFGGKG
jgi:G3E family GTPase